MPTDALRPEGLRDLIAKWRSEARKCAGRCGDLKSSPDSHMANSGFCLAFAECADELADALARLAAVPQQEWRCFHCDEVFTTPGAARDHFGATLECEPGCVIDRVALETGGTPERGRGLLMALRKAEGRIAELARENEQLENDARLWHEAEADRVRRIGNVQWWQELDLREGERLVLQQRVAELEASLAAVPERDLLTRYVECEDPVERDALFLLLFAQKIRDKSGVVMTWEIPHQVALTLESIAKRIRERSGLAAVPPALPQEEVVEVEMEASLVRQLQAQWADPDCTGWSCPRCCRQTNYKPDTECDECGFDAVSFAQSGLLEEAIRYALEGRKSHESWATWLAHCETCAECRAHAPSPERLEREIGTLADQREWVRKYDVILSALGAPQSIGIGNFKCAKADPPVSPGDPLQEKA